MTHVDYVLLATLDELGGVAPSKFRLLSEAGVEYEHGRYRINLMAAQGILEIHNGPRGAHIIRRVTHE
jgi:hypothetical protein